MLCSAIISDTLMYRSPTCTSVDRAAAEQLAEIAGINIEEYASAHGMSISWFIRSFKQFTGFTPLQYILSLKLLNAQILLESTDYTIKEISNIVGYENQLYFSRLFKKQKGMSPQEYRNCSR